MNFFVEEINYIIITEKEDMFVGEKFRTLPYKTFCTEFNFVIERLGESGAWVRTGLQ